MHFATIADLFNDPQFSQHPEHRLAILQALDLDELINIIMQANDQDIAISTIVNDLSEREEGLPWLQSLVQRLQPADLQKLFPTLRTTLLTTTFLPDAQQITWLTSLTNQAWFSEQFFNDTTGSAPALMRLLPLEQRLAWLQLLGPSQLQQANIVKVTQTILTILKDLPRPQQLPWLLHLQQQQAWFEPLILNCHQNIVAIINILDPNQRSTWLNSLQHNNFIRPEILYDSNMIGWILHKLPSNQQLSWLNSLGDQAWLQQHYLLNTIEDVCNIIRGLAVEHKIAWMKSLDLNWMTNILNSPAAVAELLASLPLQQQLDFLTKTIHPGWLKHNILLDAHAIGIILNKLAANNRLIWLQSLDQDWLKSKLLVEDQSLLDPKPLTHILEVIWILKKLPQPQQLPWFNSLNLSTTINFAEVLQILSTLEPAERLQLAKLFTQQGVFDRLILQPNNLRQVIISLSQQPLPLNEQLIALQQLQILTKPEYAAWVEPLMLASNAANNSPIESSANDIFGAGLID